VWASLAIVSITLLRKLANDGALGMVLCLFNKPKRHNKAPPSKIRLWYSNCDVKDKKIKKFGDSHNKKKDENSDIF